LTELAIDNPGGTDGIRETIAPEFGPSGAHYVGQEPQSKPVPKSKLWGDIRAHCLECLGDSGSVRRCPGDDCRLYPYRMGNYGTKNKTDADGMMYPVFKKSAIKRAIRAECVDCVGTTKDVCTSPGCSLYDYRRGHGKAAND
jgi:hypothetical protein